MKPFHILLCCAFFLAATLAIDAVSSPRGTPFVQKVAQNDGDTPASFATSCSSTAWTSLFAANPKMRRGIVQNLASGQSVCLSEINTASTKCTAATAGYTLLSPGEYEHRSEGVLYCRALDGQAAQTVKGIAYTDSGDSATIQ